MNGKKARLIRQMCKQENNYSATSEYMVTKKTKRLMHTEKADGTKDIKEIVMKSLANKSKLEYRRAKKAYKNGDFTVSWE